MSMMPAAARLSENPSNLCDRPLSQITVKPHLAAKPRDFGQIAQHDVGVRHRGLIAASGISGGTGIGASALGANAQRPW
jgi:hypothetical protein